MINFGSEEEIANRRKALVQKVIDKMNKVTYAEYKESNKSLKSGD